jgi:hypothetical protein
MDENGQKEGSQPLQVQTGPNYNGNPPLLKGGIPAIRNVKTAKRFLSRLIAGFVRGEIAGQDAKTLAYLLATYCQIVKDSDFEQRLDALEKRDTSVSKSRAE